MKYKHILIIVFIILLIDQWSKIYVKTNFYYGEEVKVLGDWCKLLFIENEGMAFGMKILDNDMGKLILTLFRLVAVVVGFFWVKKISLQGYKTGTMICAALILAGAAGNLIDCLFYGQLFSATQFPYEVATWASDGNGYAPFLHGKVVDMLYFPMIDTMWPEWVPIFGGKPLRFFEPIFNVADVAISTGIITLIVFQKSLLTPKVAHQPADQKDIA